MKAVKLFGVIILAVIAAGCAQAPITLNYAPSSTMSVDGELKVGKFKYLPAENNNRVKPNQIRNTAMGSILLEKNINEYFETAMFTESRFVGIKVKDSNNVVSGEIIEFLIDDLGYSIDWTLEVKYLVSADESSECYSKAHKIEKNTAKFANPFGTLNEVMKLNIEKVFSDSEFVSCVSQKS
ncbi:hypothetical protein [Microbulbifer sp. SSSA005]|uniref:hypothetical protein n=1 Tax=Microbulbifer sp. SSSA005 TaxID=3243378 RepID=UPI00403A1257